jgi:RNA polymerase sigma-70 factor (ECF subfamily)
MAGSEPAKKVRHSEAEERRLVEAAQRDTSRFTDIYECYFELVYAYVARRVRNRVETEDLTAEVFRKALQSLPRFKWRGAPFAAWLFRIASNMIADRAKHNARERDVSFDETRELAISGSGPSSVAVNSLPKSASGQPTAQANAATSQQTELEESEQRAELFRLVNDLAEDQRRVVVMRFSEERSIREIAQELGRSEGAVKQLQFRALQNLRERIKG